MPGFVGLVGLAIAVLLALVVAIILTWPIHFLTKLPKLKSFLIGLAIGTLLASVCLWQSFGHHEKSIEITTAQKELPELFEHNAKFIAGFDFVDGLSEGRFYQFEMTPGDFENFKKKNELALNEGRLETVQTSYISPEWFPSEECVEGVGYRPDYTRYKGRKIDHYSFYLCPKIRGFFVLDIHI
jgi:hypothetical protein